MAERSGIGNLPFDRGANRATMLVPPISARRVSRQSNSIERHSVVGFKSVHDGPRATGELIAPGTSDSNLSGFEMTRLGFE